jgi:serine/threonine protein kinase
VVLYELLTGHFPYDLDSSMADNLTTIQKAEPRKLTANGRRINDEAGTIVLKALSKEPARRYSTAGDLGNDLDRYLHGEPIEAKRDSALYVLKKTLNREQTNGDIDDRGIVAVEFRDWLREREDQ